MTHEQPFPMYDPAAYQLHEHHAQLVHVLLQRAGIPYEVEQKICTDCRRVLDETPVKRAAA